MATNSDPSTSAGSSGGDGFSITTPARSMRLLLKDLETPPALAAAIQEASKLFGFRAARDRLYIEEEIKLQYYYGGRDVACIETPDGRALVAIGTPYIENWPQILDSLNPDQRHKVAILTPEPWNDNLISSATVFFDEA